MKNISGYKLLLFLATLFCFAEVYGQSAKKNIKKLSAPSFHGRGYYKNGDGKAAVFIQKEFKKAGLLPVNGSFYQPFTFPVNTFPGNMKVIVGNKKLKAGKD